MSCVALTNVVASVDLTLLALVHWTVEHGRMFVPVTVNVTAALPAAPEDCDSVLIVGVARAALGVESVKGSAPDVPFEVVTVIVAVPGNAASVAGIAAVTCVALPKVLGCGAPFQFTAASLVKFVPVTVSVKPCALQYGVEAAEVVDADSDVSVGGVPGAVPMVKRTMFEISVVVVLLMFCVADCAEPGICTETCTVPAVARSDAGTGAVS